MERDGSEFFIEIGEDYHRNILIIGQGELPSILMSETVIILVKKKHE